MEQTHNCHFLGRTNGGIETSISGMNPDQCDKVARFPHETKFGDYWLCADHEDDWQWIGTHNNWDGCLSR